MRKFMQLSRVQIFRNERTWSTPLDPKLMCWSVLDCFITTQTSVQIRPNCFINAQLRATKSHPNFCNERTGFNILDPKPHILGRLGLFLYCTNFGAKWSELVPQNFSQRTQPIHTVGLQTHVLGRFAPFRTCTNFVAKWAKLGSLMHKFVQQYWVGFSHKERTRYTPLDPHTRVLQRFGPFRYCMNFGAKWAELVLLMRKFMQRWCVGIFRHERTRYTPLDTKLMFWGISDRFGTTWTSVQNGPN
jgi:hypothetical protein